MKILAVDDSKAVHAFLDELFAGTGLKLEHVFNGREAVDTVARPDFYADLVLLDWEMPVLTGIEALPLIRQLNQDMLILMVTSKNSMANIVEAMEKGASDYVMKPFTKAILLDKISQLTGKEVA